MKKPSRNYKRVSIISLVAAGILLVWLVKANAQSDTRVPLSNGNIAICCDANGRLAGTKLSVYADQYLGADPGAKIAAAIVALPATGGIVDASGLDLSISNATDFLNGVTKHVTLLFGCGTLTTTVTLTINNPSIVVRGCGMFGGTAIKYNGANITGNAISGVIYITGSYIELHELLLDSNGLTNYGVQANSAEGNFYNHIAVKNAVQNCFESEFEVISTFWMPICSTSATAMTTIPVAGIFVTNQGGNSSGGLHYYDARMEGLTYGAFIGNSTNVIIEGGVFENNQYGINVAPAATKFTAIAPDMENNSVRDLLDGGTGDVWEGAVLSNSATGATVDTTAKAVSFMGGFYKAGIEVRAGALGTWIGPVALPVGASISDSGTNTGIMGYTINNVPSAMFLRPALNLFGAVSTYNGISTSGLVSIQAVPTVITIGSGTSIGATSLCSTVLCPAGDYEVQVFIDITAACTTTGTYIVWLGWTDDQGAKTGSSTTTEFNVTGLGTTPATGTLALASTANYATGAQYIHITGAATGGLGSINYGTTATACGTGGPMVGKMYLSVIRIR